MKREYGYTEKSNLLKGKNKGYHLSSLAAYLIDNTYLTNKCFKGLSPLFSASDVYKNVLFKASL